ncbi:uncharacterized protein LOC144053833 [Vanacampus margaritifer]
MTWRLSLRDCRTTSLCGKRSTGPRTLALYRRDGRAPEATLKGPACDQREGECPCIHPSSASQRPSRFTMGNKIIRKRESADSQQEPAEDQKTKEMGGPGVMPIQEAVPAEELNVVLGQEVTQTSCLPNEECVSAPEPMPEACVEVDFATAPVEEKDPSSAPSLDQSTPFSSPQPSITPILEAEVGDVPAADGSPDGAEAAVSSASDPDAALKAGDAGNLEAVTDGNSEQEESPSKRLTELSLTGNDPDLIEDTPLDMGASAELIRGSDDP